MLKIRLRRMGKRHSPFYRVVVSDSRRVPTASAVDEVGHYDPQPTPPRLALDLERLRYWEEKGAQLSPTVRELMRRAESGTLEALPAEEAKPARKGAKAAKPATAAPAAAAEPAPQPAEEAPVAAAEAVAADAPADEAPAAEIQAAAEPASEEPAPAEAEAPAAEDAEKPAEG